MYTAVLGTAVLASGMIITAAYSCVYTLEYCDEAARSNPTDKLHQQDLCHRSRQPPGVAREAADADLPSREGELARRRRQHHHFPYTSKVNLSTHARETCGYIGRGLLFAAHPPFSFPKGCLSRAVAPAAWPRSSMSRGLRPRIQRSDLLRSSVAG